ncbi:hypothetical protein CCUS01_11176 [Colletotrichum cuscutae]|uniref:Uncharacterized protein n=1 Tax=Colletotrichum cuscutae TaxID=1209917 RepID=A0AAI9U831_9PEZI|nr:hypothetical protein CCUS01_11176 [Colletotrichum cuscutae]
MEPTRNFTPELDILQQTGVQRVNLTMASIPSSTSTAAIP